MTRQPESAIHLQHNLFISIVAQHSVRGHRAEAVELNIQPSPGYSGFDETRFKEALIESFGFSLLLTLAPPTLTLHHLKEEGIKLPAAVWSYRPLSLPFKGEGLGWGVARAMSRFLSGFIRACRSGNAISTLLQNQRLTSLPDLLMTGRHFPVPHGISAKIRDSLTRPGQR